MWVQKRTLKPRQRSKRSGNKQTMNHTYVLILARRLDRSQDKGYFICREKNTM